MAQPPYGPGGPHEPVAPNGMNSMTNTATPTSSHPALRTAPRRASAAPPPRSLPEPSPELRPGPACAFCQGNTAPRLRLDREGTRDILTTCLPCLRSAALMKAARNEARGVRLLDQDAAQRGLELWRSKDVVYLLAGAPAQPRAARTMPR